MACNPLGGQKGSQQIAFLLLAALHWADTGQVAALVALGFKQQRRRLLRCKLIKIWLR